MRLAGLEPATYGLKVSENSPDSQEKSDPSQRKAQQSAIEEAIANLPPAIRAAILALVQAVS